MKSKQTIFICLATVVLVICGCVGSKLGSQKNEKVGMNQLPKNDVVYNALEKNQENKGNLKPLLNVRVDQGYCRLL